MRKFLIRTGVFFFIVGCLAGLFWLVNESLFDKINHKLPDEIDTIVCGASISRNALNDSILPGTQNISIAGRSCLDFYLISKRVKRENPHLRRIITDFSVQGLSGYRDYLFYAPRFAGNSFSRIYPLAKYSDLNAYPLNYKKYFKVLLHEKFTPNTEYWKMFWSGTTDTREEIPYIGKYTDRLENDLSDSLLHMGIERYFYFKGKPMPQSKIDLQFLDSLIFWTEKVGVELIIFSGPTHPSAKKLLPPMYIAKYFEKMNYFESFDHVEVLDFIQYPMPDSCFANHNHLNYHGAKIISEVVRDTLHAIDQAHNKD